MNPQLQYVGPYSPEAYNAASIIQGGGTGTPYTYPIIQAGQAINAAQPTKSNIDQDAVSQYDQAIANTRAGIDRLGNQLTSGYSDVDASYQNALNQLLLGKNQGETAYNSNKQQAATNYVGAKNTIGANAGNTLRGLLRLLGSRGAGGSSAYTQAAPDTVGRLATQQRAEAGNAYGQNQRALDTSWNNYLTGYGNQVASAGSQRTQQRQSLEQNINNNRAALLQSLASLTNQRATAAGGSGTAVSQPYLDQANALLNQTSNYTTKPIDLQTQAYQAPSLSSYNITPTVSTPQTQTGSDYFSPYLSALLGKKQLAGA